MTECVPVPVDPTGETVTLPKADDEALLERLEDLEDILAAARVETRNAIPWEDYKAMESGAVSPLRYWRERCGLSQSALARVLDVDVDTLV